ncbi:carbohydrate ABC transporter permease [Devosia sp.]|uniref:carbohydrate ABC transporter permease n=1 Tax=Devosia sp. TaxID=1871048 RepID=UPI003A8E9750
MTDMTANAALQGAPARRPKRRFDSKKLFAIALLVVPALALFSIFVLWPLINAFIFSFYKWNGYGPITEFVGVENYDDVITQRHFSTAIRNTIILSVVSLLIQLPLALWVALALYQKAWFVSIFRTIFFVPYMLADVAAGLIWKFVYDGNYGLLPAVGDLTGTELPFVLADRFWVIPAIGLVIVWKYFGFHMMIYIAGLQSIPNEVLEAARLDGVSKWKIMWYVKIPMIRNSIVISVFFAIVGSLQLFDVILPLTGGGPSNSSHTIVSFLYQFGILRMKIGFGGAVSVILFILCVAVTLIYRRLLFTRDPA